MVRIIIALLFCFPAVTFAQTYQQLSERAIECIEKDSLPQAEELLLQALKLEPKNAKNALLFSNLGLVQRRLGEFDKALESYSFALNFAPLAVPILLDRAAIYMEMGKTDRAYTDYCQPCMLMVKNVFSLNAVADFYNQNFINLKMHFGKEKELAEKYGTSGYPAFLFINGDGKLVYMESGYTEGDEFIGYGQTALEKAKGIEFIEDTAL